MESVKDDLHPTMLLLHNDNEDENDNAEDENDEDEDSVFSIAIESMEINGSDISKERTCINDLLTIYRRKNHIHCKLYIS